MRREPSLNCFNRTGLRRLNGSCSEQQGGQQGKMFDHALQAAGGSTNIFGHGRLVGSKHPHDSAFEKISCRAFPRFVEAGGQFRIPASFGNHGPQQTNDLRFA